MNVFDIQNYTKEVIFVCFYYSNSEVAEKLLLYENETIFFRSKLFVHR